MLFANVNNEKIEARPKAHGKCPLCERDVFSKCGEVNVWHWAHHKDESCDSWYEPETEWHKSWKLVFGKDNCEIVISKEGIRHIADILTPDNVVIELQNSPIQKPIIRKREIFYGERMLWVINGKHFKDNFRISSLTLNRSIRDEIKFYLSHNLQSIESAQSKAIKPKDEFIFSWSWCRKSWCEVQRNVFIDFGDENLFWVHSGMGTSIGKGRKIRKEAFLRKYGGNLNVLETLISDIDK